MVRLLVVELPEVVEQAVLAGACKVVIPAELSAAATVVARTA